MLSSMTKLSDLGPPMSGKQPDRLKARGYDRVRVPGLSLGC
ncbi:hypothetical protein MPLB_2300037 [Mesorhizobium sp. ORS 3324]|nr:hypothetical protein MPLB_2300037 [Mesorhizobium sp. ORS 3324]